MGFSFKAHESVFTGEFITVKTAAEISGYNEQYLRRLLRKNTFRSKRIGQLWLIDRDNFMKYILQVKRSTDNRFGPQHKPTNHN